MFPYDLALEYKFIVKMLNFISLEYLLFQCLIDSKEMIVFGFIVIYHIMLMFAIDEEFLHVIERNNVKKIQNTYHFHAFHPSKKLCLTS